MQGISDIIITPGLINRDFSDIKATMVGMGYAMMGTAIGRGENAAVEAARQAINCPLLEDTKIAGSRGILINVTGSSQLGLHEVHEACSHHPRGRRLRRRADQFRRDPEREPWRTR